MSEILNKPYNILFIVSILIIIGLLLIAMIMRKFNKKRNFITFENDGFLDKAYSLSNIWLNAAMFWMTLEYIFVISAFEASIIVIYLTSLEANYQEILVYSIISLLLMVVSYEVNPKRHMRCYRKSFVNINKGINSYINALQERRKK